MPNDHGLFHHKTCTFQGLEIVNITSTDTNSFHSDPNIMGSEKGKLERLNLEGVDTNKPGGHVFFFFFCTFALLVGHPSFTHTAKPPQTVNLIAG
uniref:Sorbitol dehydrogenase n=1 Tax=Rhizophora mucronata TaxID=61149 RepID=A0A2P2LWW3_RHIMU